jgi:poly-gamma-glutamate capsule biosynthesis protein CapA/YwtB (metallophosphatase superfamily)
MLRAFRKDSLAVALLAACVLGAPVFAQESAPASQPEQQAAAPRERTLLFVGDVMLSRGVGARMRAAGDWTYPFQKIADALAAADLTFGNLEGPISDAGRDRRHLYSFRADPKAVEGLKYAGFDVMSVANNHTYDWGAPALLDTLGRLREAGILPVGAGANDLEAHYPVLVDLQGVKIAFLAYVDVEPKAATAGPNKPGVAWLEPERVLADIRFAHSLADLVIVSLHWGIEYAPKPQREQVELARQLIDAGADLVVGAHPHVVQPVEQYGNGWIAYSLGNFVFDQKPPATHRGLMLKVTLRGERISEVSTVSVTIEPTFQAVIAPAERQLRDAERAARQAKAKAVRAQ